MNMDYFELIAGSADSRDDGQELTFGDLLSECRESSKEKVDETKLLEVDYDEDNDEFNKKGKKKNKGNVDAGVNGDEEGEVADNSTWNQIYWEVIEEDSNGSLIK